jgi:y4mF family transcriptional regulator
MTAGQTSSSKSPSWQSHPDRDIDVSLAASRRSQAASKDREHPDRDVSIAQFVRSHRRAERLSQRGLAELAGVGPRVVWELEGGKRTLRMDVVNAILRVFGKSLGVVDAVRDEDGE